MGLLSFPKKYPLVMMLMNTWVCRNIAPPKQLNPIACIIFFIGVTVTWLVFGIAFFVCRGSLCSSIRGVLLRGLFGSEVSLGIVWRVGRVGRCGR
jgi:hypothetical protein